MDDKTRRPKRQNIYFPDHMIDYLSQFESLSGRVTQIIDRYHEALRRTKVEQKFSNDELFAIRSACHSWFAEPAATIFGGIDLELEDSGADRALVEKVAALSPFEQVALIEYVERAREANSDASSA